MSLQTENLQLVRTTDPSRHFLMAKAPYYERLAPFMQMGEIDGQPVGYPTEQGEAKGWLIPSANFPRLNDFFLHVTALDLKPTARTPPEFAAQPRAPVHYLTLSEFQLLFALYPPAVLEKYKTPPVVGAEQMDELRSQYEGKARTETFEQFATFATKSLFERVMDGMASPDEFKQLIEDPDVEDFYRAHGAVIPTEPEAVRVWKQSFFLDYLNRYYAGRGVQRGDLIRMDFLNYRNDGLFIHDGAKFRDLEYDIDDYGAIPREFKVPAPFPLRYWEDTMSPEGKMTVHRRDHNSMVWPNFQDPTFRFNVNMTPAIPMETDLKDYRAEEGKSLVSLDCEVQGKLFRIFFVVQTADPETVKAEIMKQTQGPESSYEVVDDTTLRSNSVEV